MRFTVQAVLVEKPNLDTVGAGAREAMNIRRTVCLKDTGGLQRLGKQSDRRFARGVRRHVA